jgi:lipoprotein-anchoring transpeptidase ErfK/SrfK
MTKFAWAGVLAGCIALSAATAAYSQDLPASGDIVPFVSDLAPAGWFGEEPAAPGTPTPPPAPAKPVAPLVHPLIIRAMALKPGEFAWAPEIPTAGATTIDVSIERQLAFVYRNDQLIAVSTISSGRRNHETPTGTFRISQKREKHFSNLYNNAPMPFMQRLTNDGIALHAGALPGYRASHGCIRLPHAFARSLFGVTQLGTPVTVRA